MGSREDEIIAKQYLSSVDTILLFLVSVVGVAIALGISVLKFPLDVTSSLILRLGLVSLMVFYVYLVWLMLHLFIRRDATMRIRAWVFVTFVALFLDQAAAVIYYLSFLYSPLAAANITFSSLLPVIVSAFVLTELVYFSSFMTASQIIIHVLVPSISRQLSITGWDGADELNFEMQTAAIPAKKSSATSAVKVGGYIGMLIMYFVITSPAYLNPLVIVGEIILVVFALIDFKLSRRLTTRLRLGTNGSRGTGVAFLVLVALDFFVGFQSQQLLPILSGFVLAAVALVFLIPSKWSPVVLEDIEKPGSSGGVAANSDQIARSRRKIAIILHGHPGVL